MKKFSRFLFTLLALISLVCSSTSGQTVSVFPVQNLSFGAFIQGINGGKVTVSNAGIRFSEGDVILASLGAMYFPAIFDIVAPQGTVITILNGPDVQLNGSNGGAITLRLGTSDKGASFATSTQPPQRTSVSIGGTLTIGNQQSVPAGNYSGTFSVTFINQ
ncbi:MAG TPA: DUF4402 domain-containing protein [Pedobacter sp.]